MICSIQHWKKIKKCHRRVVKESLFAHLDKKDAESYKKRFIGWKRIALLLLLILAGLILYESGIVKTGTAHSTKEIVPLAKETKETGPNVTGKVAYDGTNPRE